MNGLQRNRKHVREIISLVKCCCDKRKCWNRTCPTFYYSQYIFSPSFIVFLEWCPEITKPYFKDFFKFLSQNKSLRQSFTIDTRKKRGAHVPVVIYILSQQKIFTFYHRGGYDAPVPLPNNMKKYILVYRQVPVGRE